MYIGGFERNFPSLTATSTSFEGSDGQQHAYTEWPADVDGLRIGYMEKAGKKFVAVRLADDINDVVLLKEVILLPGEHFGYSVRLSGTPTILEDDVATLKLLEDIIKRNEELGGELMLVRARLKAGSSRK